MALAELVAEHRYSVLMLLALLLLIGVSGALGGLFGIFLMPFAVLSAAVAAGLAAIARGFAPEEPPAARSWFVELYTASLTVAMVYALLAAGAGIFYMALLGATASALILARPRFKRITPADVSTGLGAGIAAFIIVFLIASLLGLVMGGTSLVRDILGQSLLAIAQLEAPLMLLLVAVPEELWARALMYSAVRRYVPAKTAAFWATLLFIAMHIPTRVVWGIFAPFVIGLIGISALVICYVYYKYAEHPLVSILAHTTYNSLLYAVSYGFITAVGVAVGLAVIYYVIKSYAVGE